MQPLKILIVEDHRASLELMTEVFVSLNAEVHPIGDSEKASALVNQEKFDGIFLDLEMPKLNGFDLARLIRTSPRNKSTPIIIVTGRDERQTMKETFALGATFFLQKPVDRQKLSMLFRTVSGGMLQNRRKYVRAPLNIDVTCTVGSKTLRGVSWNISQGGMQVEVGGLQEKDAVQLSLKLPSSGVALDVAGVVVWANAMRQGIQFTSERAPAQHAIRQFIADNEDMDEA
jgi:CheY-like chemotaxis protein